MFQLHDLNRITESVGKSIKTAARNGSDAMLVTRITVLMLKNVHFITGQHLKKSSLSESSSDMMDLEDAVDTTPNLLPDSQVRLVPFFGTTVTTVDKSLQQNNCYKQTSSNGQSTQQRHNSALAVSIETDV